LSKGIFSVISAGYSGLLASNDATPRFGDGGGLMGAIGAVVSWAFGTTDVCLPSLTGRATISPNVVHLKASPEQFKSTDHHYRVVNSTTHTDRLIRNAAEVSIAVSRLDPDWYEVEAVPDFGLSQDLGSTGESRRRDPLFSLSDGTGATTLVTINGDGL